MKAVRLKDNLYKEAEKVSKAQGVKVEEIIPRALKHGLFALNEQNVLELYRRREITLQKGATMLSIDIWDMIERVKKADIHLDYSHEELKEDLN